MQDALKEERFLTTFRDTMQESAHVLQKKFGFTEESLSSFIEKNIKRFSSPLVRDDVLRVCRSPVRKLSPTDRLVAPAMLAAEYGYGYEKLAQAIAAVFLFENDQDEQAVEIKKYVQQNGIAEAITHFTTLPSTSTVYQVVLANYDRLAAIKQN